MIPLLCLLLWAVFTAAAVVCVVMAGSHPSLSRMQDAWSLLAIRCAMLAIVATLPIVSS